MFPFELGLLNFDFSFNIAHARESVKGKIWERDGWELLNATSRLRLGFANFVREQYPLKRARRRGLWGETDKKHFWRTKANGLVLYAKIVPILPSGVQKYFAFCAIFLLLFILIMI